MHYLSRILFTIFLYSPYVLSAQVDSSYVSILDSISIQSYYGKSLLQTPAAVNYISEKDLSRFSNTNMLQAINSTPGVRMEERSPGSYRLSIRGSSVRSPFGVRNVKIYYAGIPFTAPGGASMLNMMGFYNIGSIEVIKGPGGSMYGAGTGGVLLIEPKNDTQKLTAGMMGGSFGMMGAYAAVALNKNRIGYEHLQSDGYRDHTHMRRDNIFYNGTLLSSSKNKLEAHLLYSNLFYETPGALTLTEFNINPRAARPPTATFPGAGQAKASIHQQAMLLGLSNRFKISSSINNATVIYGLYGYTKNPTVQNYERKTEPHIGGRTVFNIGLKKGHSVFEINTGLEFQKGYFGYKTYRNKAGNRDTLRLNDVLDIQQYFVFAQVNWKYKNWIWSTGASVNNMALDFERKSAQGTIWERKKFDPAFVPRFALLYKVNKTIAVFTNLSRGFSPPAAEEIFADNNSYNLSLQPEKSWNIEPGIRGSLFNKKLNFDLSYFSARLTNSIVTRRDSAGGNYFVNAGKSAQKGFEASLGYEPFSKQTGFLAGSSLRLTYSYYNFRYKEFLQSGNDYSGNRIPGISPNNVNLLADIQTTRDIYFNFSYSYTGEIKLNDANSAAASAFHLLSLKAGYKKRLYKILLSFYLGADNIADVRYSLGNDINGFGGRYYNVAAGRSFYAGVLLSL